MNSLPLAWRLALRELRAGLAGFRVFLACLILGVAAIAGIGSVSESVIAGIRADARTLLGGDIDLRLTHRAATPEQRAWLDANTARRSDIAEMRAMAKTPDGNARNLVELKAVDGRYPLFGGFRLADDTPLADAITKRGDQWGAVAEQRLLDKLGVGLGDTLRVGDARFILTGVIAEEADRATRAFNLGPRLLVGFPGLKATNLLQPGSLIRYHYRIEVPQGTGHKAWVTRLNEQFPNAGWRIRAIDNAAPNIQRFVDRVTLFLSLIGLTALLVGGVGVGNAVKSYLDSRLTTIATLKCLGGPGPLVFQLYLLQVLGLALLAIAVGVAVGAALPMIGAPLLSQSLPIEAQVGFYPQSLALAAVFGLLVTIAFSLWPLGQAREVPAASLFRAVVAPLNRRPRLIYIASLLLVVLALAGLTVATAYRPGIAAVFVVSAIVTVAIFHGAARAIIALINRLPRPRNPIIRLALANLSRPGTSAASVVLSLGLGLTVLGAVALIEGNLSNQINRNIPEEAPGFYFIDIQGNQVAEFEKLVKSFPNVASTESVPMLRGRLMRLNGTPVEEITPPPDFAWILRGDRGLTWARTPPALGNRLTAGEWWPADYSGEPLVSFDARAAEAFGLKIGDSLTVNVLGRAVTAKIANLREIDWTTLSINFVMIFSPGLLESARQSYISTAKADDATELALERAITDRFPNVSAIRVKEVLESVSEILDRLSTAVRAIAGIAVLAGGLVLAGAIAATRRRRIYDAVLLKVLGATRREVLATYLVEFGLLGLVTAAVAAVIGTAASWAVIIHVMRADWTFIPGAVIGTTAACVVITVVAGFIGTWRALGHKAAPILRND
jgi:putative ABC transport system permease protein